MTDRREWDRPAMVITVVLGVVVVGASIPFTVIAYCEQEGCGAPQEWHVTWSALDAGDETVSIDSTGFRASGQASISVTDIRVQQVVATLRPNECTDTFNPQLGQQPTTFSYSIVRRPEGADEETLAEGTFTCPAVSAAGFTVRLDNTTHPGLFGHPDLGRVTGGSEAEARAAAWSEVGGNDTSTFVLTLTGSRAASTPALPGGVPGFETRMEARMQFEVDQTAVTVEEPPEVLR